MYTATLKSKEEVAQGIRVTIDFSNGIKTLTETVIPQDEIGFKHWVKSRLASLNSIEEISTKYDVDAEVDISDPEPPAKTAAELAEEQWFIDYSQWIRVKETLIDTGVVPADNPKVVALLNKVKTGLKVEYIDKL